MTPTIQAGKYVHGPTGKEFHIRTIKVGNYTTYVSDQRFPVQTEHIAHIEQTLSRWQSVFPEEPTWVRENFGVPSLFVRVDCAIKGEEVKYYEVEERPLGMGLLREFVPGSAERLAQVRAEWPEFGYVSSTTRGVTEDSLWLERAKPGSDDLVVVRAEPYEYFYHSYQPRSVSTIAMEGDKWYGVELGWWTVVTEDDVLPFDTGFVLKPLQGSKCLDVHFHAPLLKRPKKERNRPRKGIDRLLAKSNSDIGQIEGVLRKYSERRTNRGMCCQPFIMPMLSGIPEHELMIYRLMFGWSPSLRTWQYIGGLWNGRDSLRIHGAEDTLFGPVVLETSSINA